MHLILVWYSYLKRQAYFNQNFQNSMHCVLPEISGCLRGVLGVWSALQVAHAEQLSEKKQAIQRHSLDKHLSFKSKRVSGAVLSVESSMLPQNSLLTAKITGKMHANCFYVALKPQCLLGEADLSCKFNREFY